MLVQIVPLLVIFPFYLVMNFAILFGPLLIMNLSQIQALRAGRRGVGRQARGRPRPGGGEGGGAPRGLDLAVGRGIRARGRQARARPPLPRRARHREDDAREGARDRLQLAVHLDPGFGLRGDVHRHRRDRRARPRPAREAARAQVGRSVHRLHRRDRRRRHAPAGAQPWLRRRGRRLPALDVHDLLCYGPFGALNPSGDLILENHQLARAPLRRARAAVARRVRASRRA